ncbi:rhodanese-like domain-containing protein [Labilibaculum sp.]|uniref:rhodanese-like domain-containing protein n=1 Tax=Labilibaculum sp. TaxID=2060723 RepID=UPI003562EEE3
MFLLILSTFAIIFGIYWYFFHTPDYAGYVTTAGSALKKYSNVEDLMNLTQNPEEDIWILDVREEEYYVMDHIPTAKNFPYDEVEKWHSKIPLGTQLIIYCDLSLKSQTVIDFLEQKGHTQMLNWGKYKKWIYPEVVEEDISI